MGNPTNYSLELPARCLKLLEGLWSYAAEIYLDDRVELGPLTSTFLISMSMPMINLPIERIERPVGEEHRYYVTDRPITPAAVATIQQTLSRQLSKAPFFVAGEWRFARCEKPPFPNIARGVPEPIAMELDSDKGVQNATDMPASQWCSILRNALAHGGIAYLDARGRSQDGEPIKMYAFVSGNYDRDSKEDPKPLTAVNFLRISESDYLKFLRRWVNWLQGTGISDNSEGA